ncbi:hypothetical protein [Geopseudomonas guangdongensis]|uniref:Uncharacterized protein n=1 Tax=Geopseudomonas guangdongensis TaxID=1245526 RepID=A0A1H2HHM9_9GAMM|nr:hypothetical protein [Pseudomonas guangdongensis]SDU31058.1 hypothetical protein SAMN05216580_2323 [Pseudomonas guangdongensis]
MRSLKEFFVANSFANCSKVYVGNNVPPKLVSNAIGSFGFSVSPQEIAVLLDDTLFGSGKDGCLVCEGRIIFKEAFSDAIEYSYDEINLLQIDGSEVFINGRKVHKFTMPDKKDLKFCFEVLNKWISLKKKGAEKTSSVPVAEVSGGMSDAQRSMLADVIVECASDLGVDKVFVAPNIPPSKLYAAINSYGNDIKPEQVLVLVDDTVFGSAKDGLVITDSVIAMKFMMESPKVFHWKFLESVVVAKRKLFFNGREVGQLTQLGEKELGELFRIVDGFLKDLRSGKVDECLDGNAANANPAPVVEIKNSAIPTDGVAKVESKESATEISSSQAPRAISQVQNLPLADRALTEGRVAPSTSPRAVVSDQDSDAVSIEESVKNDVRVSDKVSGMISSAIEQNKSKIIPMLKEKGVELSLAALRSDENVEKLAGFLYAFLPGVVRFALKEQVFVQFVLDNRNKLLAGIFKDEAKVDFGSEEASKCLVRAERFEDDLAELLGESTGSALSGGNEALRVMSAVLQDLRSELASDADYELVYGLAINNLNAVLSRAEKISGYPREKVEEQILFILSIMYGFSFHKIPESFRKEENVFTAFFMGFFAVCEKYEERSGASGLDTQKDCVPIALGMAKVITKDQLNEMIKKIISGHKAAKKPGDFELDDIMALLREANGFAEKWISDLTRKMVQEEREMHEKWGDLIS